MTPPRTGTADVRATLLADYGEQPDGSKADLVPFIRRASMFVDRVATCAANRGVPLTADEQKELETLLASHMYVLSDQAQSSRSTDGASASFQGQTGLYLDGSKYGQMALMMDVSGCLAGLNKQARASASWLGKNPSSQIPYENRS